MNIPFFHSRSTPSRMAASTAPSMRQRGVIMVVALITLALLMIGAVAAIRSMSVSLNSVGNFAFKRDMTNQAERAMQLASAALVTGALSGQTAREADNATQFYSATMLPSSPQGIPTALLQASNDAAVPGLGYVDLASGGNDQGTRLHYVIDRLCLNNGPLDQTTCQTASVQIQGGPGQPALTAPAQALFRISVRVTGPRNSQSFYQATFTAL